MPEQAALPALRFDVTGSCSGGEDGPLSCRFESEVDDLDASMMRLHRSQEPPPAPRQSNRDTTRKDAGIAFSRMARNGLRRLQDHFVAPLLCALMYIPRTLAARLIPAK
jgi:hypothetical protein